MESRYDSVNPPTFWCHICNLGCYSAVNLHSHFLGAKHKRAEEALKEGQEEGVPPEEDVPAAEEAAKEEEEAKEQESLQDQINACQNTEPALGLEYIYEYESLGNIRYECRLCNCFLGRTHMFMHIVGIRHRILYLAEHHPSLNINNTSVFKKKGRKLKKLRETCVQVEEEFGRQQINVVKEDDKTVAIDDVMARRSAMSMMTRCKGFKQAKVKVMDFTSDNFTEEPEEEVPEVITFQKLKAEYEASKKKQIVAPDGSIKLVAGVSFKGLEGQAEEVQPSGAQKEQTRGCAKNQAGGTERDHTGGPQQGQAGLAKSQAGGPEKDHMGGPQQGQAGLAKSQPGGPKKDQAGGPQQGQVGEVERDQAGLAKNHVGGPDKEQNVEEAEHKPVLDAFSGPDEVFEYLESFEVFDLRHVHYLMKVTEKLKSVLGRHQNKVESVAEAQVEENNQTSADQEIVNVDENQEGAVVPPNEEGSAEESDTEPADTESSQAVELPASQQENKETQPFLGIKSRRSNKKLSFRISGAPAEKSLVSSEVLSSMQYEFAAKSKANKMAAASGTCTDDADLSEVPMQYGFASKGTGDKMAEASASCTDDADLSEVPMVESEDSEEENLADQESTMEAPSRAAHPDENVPDPALSFRSGFHGTRDVEEERSPSKPRSMHAMSNRPDRAGAAPFPNEESAMGTSSRAPYPHELLGNPASLTNQASNELSKNVDDFPTAKSQTNSAPYYPPHDQTYSAYTDFDATWSSNEAFDNFDDIPAPKAPKTPERVTKSAPSQPARDPMKTSAGSVSSRASNEHFRNVDEFPPSKAPNTQDWMRHSAPSYHPRDPMRTSAGPGATWASNERFRNDDYPPSKAPNTQERRRRSSRWAPNEPSRNVDDFPPPSAPNTQERMRHTASYTPRDPMRAPAGSVSRWAPNEPSRNVDDFPPPSAPNTQERMRHSAPLYPRDPVRTSAGPGETWASNEPYRNDDYPPSRAPNTQERMRHSAHSYPPHDPMSAPAGSASTWTSKKNVGGFPPSSAPNAQDRRNSAPYPPRDPMRTSAGSDTAWTSNEPFRNVGGFPPHSAANTQERMRNSAPPYPPREPMGASAGSAPTWSSNKPFDNGGFAPPSAQNAPERMRSPAPPYPHQEPMRTSGFPRGQGTQDMLRNTAGYSGGGPPDSYRQPRNPGPCPPPGPRASMPAFPNDDVTAKFFDSLKEMDVSEVTATLHKITATNPAFRGINVPSLVRYLMDTGKIKPSANTPGNV